MLDRELLTRTERFGCYAVPTPEQETNHMKPRSFGPAAGAVSAVAVFLFASIASAASTRVVRRGGAVRANAASTAAVSYSVEVPVVTRLVGSALFRTAIDISNNTSSG